jgi:hypothetical protein
MVFAQGAKEVIAIFIIYLATAINQFLLVEGVLELFERKALKKKVIALFLLKMAILAAALYLGVHLMGKRVIIPLLNYIVLIFVLGVSLNGKHQGKLIQ